MGRRQDLRRSIVSAFPAAVSDEIEEGLGENPLDQVMFSEDRPTLDPVEDLIAEETLVDDFHIPGLLEDRRRMWKKLPQRVRIGVRRLHRQFGHVPKQVMINLLRAAKVRKEFIDAVRLHRCETCEKTSPKKPTHKVSLPGEYSFNHTLGIDVLEVVDAEGNPYQVLNMVCVGTTFQLAEVVRAGKGQPSSKACLDALVKRWFSGAGYPTSIVCDRGLHNRGVLSQFMDEHNIQVYHTPLERPEGTGRVERHGAILKAMYRKVYHETGANTKEQVEPVLTQRAQVKNDTARLGGFSPSQWVLGRAPRTLPFFASEEEHASLDAIAARHDPSSIFALQHQARLEAQKAYVHLDCSRRDQKALLRNAVPFDREFSVGDLVTFRRDNQRGGASWPPVSRVLGHEGSKNIWLLCGNFPVLVFSHNVRIASPNEALAQAVLNGEPVVPFEVVHEDGQQCFLDVRRSTQDREEEPTEIPMEAPITNSIPTELPPVPESDELPPYQKMMKLIGIFDQGFSMEKREKKKSK